jgi:hypothetical protein
MQQTNRRRIAASLTGLALAAATLVLGGSPANAASAQLNCLGADTDTQSLLNTLAPAGTPLPASLDIDVEGNLSAPSVVDTNATFNANFAPKVTLPQSLVDSLGGFGVTSATISNLITNISTTNANPATIASPPYGVSMAIPSAGNPLSVSQPQFGGSFTATGPDQSLIRYKIDSMNFSVAAALGAIPVNLNLTCTPTGNGEIGATNIIQPGPPQTPDVTFDVALGGVKTVTIPVTGNPEVDTVELVDTPTLGGATVAKVGNLWRLTYTQDANAGAGTDTFKYRADNGYDDGDPGTDDDGISEGTITVNVLDNLCEANPSCSLSQIIEVDVVGTNLSMQQAGGNVVLDPVTLDGSPQSTTGELNLVTVKDARGNGAAWSLTGTVTDFKTDPSVGNCPAGTPASWDYRCIPANNLGWAPAAEVAHEVIPGDVAAVTAGSISDTDAIKAGTAGSGLASQQSLCGAEATHGGGTFACGAGLALLIPASASAGTYSATLTLTLA